MAKSRKAPTRAQSKNLAKARRVSELMREGLSKTEARREAGAGTHHRSPTHHSPPVHHREPRSPAAYTLEGHEATSLSVRVGTRPVVEYNTREMASILSGFISETRAPCGPDLTDYLGHRPAPATIRQQDGGFVIVGEPVVTLREQLPGEWALGAELVHELGKAIRAWNLTAQEWAQIYLRALAEHVQPGQVCPVPSGVPMIPPPGGLGPFSASQPGQGPAGAWSSPLAIPTQVTSPFNVTRSDGELHHGVDLRAPVGSSVRAPRSGTVGRVWYDASGGGESMLIVHDRENGTAPHYQTIFPGDDSGYRTTFMHLSGVAQGIAEGSHVERGQVVAFSGGEDTTGEHTSGPHLHWQLEYLRDNPIFNDHLYVNPVALVGEQGLETPDQVFGPTGQDVVADAVLANPKTMTAVSSTVVISGTSGNVNVDTGQRSTTVSPSLGIGSDILGLLGLGKGAPNAAAR